MMNNNNDNKDIKFTGDPVAFDGAEGKRDPKVGKGRFDLIPTEVYHPLFKMAARNWLIDCNPASIMTSIADELFLKAIIQMTVYSYLDTTKIEGGIISTTAFWRCVWPMLQDLAIHFQKGAEHYGERNCQKGIPLWSFKDSAMRHAAQTFEGKEDEPHKISVIWNLWMAQWTVIQERRKTVDAISGPPMTLYEMNKDWVNQPTNKEQTPREKAKAFMADYLDELKADLTEIIKSLKDSRKDLMLQEYKYMSDSMEYISINQSVADLKRIIKGLQCVADHVGIPIVTAEQKPDKPDSNMNPYEVNVARGLSFTALLNELVCRLRMVDGNPRPVKQRFVEDYQKQLLKIVQLVDAIKRSAAEPDYVLTPKTGVLPSSAAAKYVLVHDKYAELREEIKQENSVTEEAAEPAKDTVMEEFNKAIAEGPVERLLGELTEELSHELRLCQSSPTFANAWQFVHKYRESLNKMLEVWNQIAAAAYDPKLGDKHSDDK